MPSIGNKKQVALYDSFTKAQTLGLLDNLSSDIQENKEYVGGSVLVDSLSATFTNVDNNINAAGIGVGVEVGDVIQVSGSTNNDTEFTVDVITDDDNVIVNQAHAGDTTSKALTDETASVTVKLLCKWYLAPIGLGQGWVDVKPARATSTPYSNETGRTIAVSIVSGAGDNQFSRVFVDNVEVAYAEGAVSGTSSYSQIKAEIPSNGVYEHTSDGVNIIWAELR